MQVIGNKGVIKMIKLWRVLLLVVLFVAYSVTAFAAGFSGSWECDKVITKFQITLEETGKTLIGTHHSYIRYGARIDSSGDKISIQGVVNGNVATVTWISGYNYAKGKAIMTMIDENTIRWKKTEVTVAQAHYIPDEAILKRVIPGQQATTPAPWGPADSVFMNGAGEPTRFTLNGSIDDVVSVLRSPTKQGSSYQGDQQTGHVYVWDNARVSTDLDGKILSVKITGYGLLTARGIGYWAPESFVEQLYGPPERTWIANGYLQWAYDFPGGAQLILGFNTIHKVEFVQYTITPGQ